MCDTYAMDGVGLLDEDRFARMSEKESVNMLCYVVEMKLHLRRLGNLELNQKLFKLD